MRSFYYIIIASLLLTGGLFADSKEEKAAMQKLPSRITYEVQGQNFGKNLISYMHAKWISYSNKIPLLIKPFPYSNQLALYASEKKLNDQGVWNSTLTIDDENDVIYMDPAKTLYIVPYFQEIDPEYQETPIPYFSVNWKDKEFMNQIREMIKPTSGFTPFKLPKGRVTVAVHVKRKANGDTSDDSEMALLKYPPDEFYINQIKRLSEKFKSRPMYVYIFTNHRNPGVIGKAFQEAANAPHITFDWRRTGNHQKGNIVDDFFNMSRFSCLIRPQSNFSIAAELCGSFSLVIKPVKARWSPGKNKYVISQIKAN